MNQILATAPEANNNNYSVNKYNNYQKPKSNTVEIKKVIIVFCSILIIFGGILLAEGCFNIFSNIGKKEELANAPTVIFEEMDDYLTVNISSEKPMIKIVYYWDNNEQVIKNINNKTAYSLEVETVVGKNTLNVIVTDNNGQEYVYKKEYSYIDDGKDIKKPILELKIDENTKRINITAKDESGLEYITYRWNNEEETKIEAEDDNKYSIEKSIDIPVGENELTVVVVDESNNTQEKSQKFEGWNVPQINVYIDAEYLVIQVQHSQQNYKEGLSLVKYALNGKTYKIDFKNIYTKDIYNKLGIQVEFTTDGKVKKMEYRQKMVEGNNKLDVYAYSLQEKEATYSGSTEYVP